MGWQKGAQNHLNTANVKSGFTVLAVWDPSLGDDLGVTFVRGTQKNKDAPTSTLLKGATEHVVVQ